MGPLNGVTDNVINLIILSAKQFYKVLFPKAGHGKDSFDNVICGCCYQK